LLWEQISQLNAGRTRNVGQVTLTDSSATTTVDDPLFESVQKVFFSPLTANAAAELATMYVSSKAEGQFVITHANNAQTDRDFEYIIVG
jgi:hypothetical protein